LNESGLTPLDVQNKVASQGLYDSFEAAGLAKARLQRKKRRHMVNIAILASFVNFLLPPRTRGEGWGGVKNLRLLQGLLYRALVV
jgi:hypothetical protein